MFPCFALDLGSLFSGFSGSLFGSEFCWLFSVC